MTDPAILDAIFKELKRAKKKHPRWPVHLTAQAGIVVEEAGEVMRACLNKKYEGKTSGRSQEDMMAEIRTELIHTAASCIRFLEQLFNNQTDNYVNQNQKSKTDQGGEGSPLGL